MHNRSEFTANQFLSGQQKRYNKQIERKNTPSDLALLVLVFGSNLALFVLVFGAIGFMFVFSFFG